MNNDQRISPSIFKLKTPTRNQYEFSTRCLDDLIPQEHKARHVWEFVSQMDLSACFTNISTYQNYVGRSKIDPKILLTLWIYSILDGNSSARKLEELCLHHDAYKWICGGISLSRTTLAEFRSDNPRKFDELLIKCLAVMVKNELLSDSDFSQDGTRVKANAGNNSFRREDSLKELESKMAKYIDVLKKEEKASTDVYEKRKSAQKIRRATERSDRIKSALRSLEAAQCEKIINGKRNHDKVTEKDLKKVRASTTDPEVRKMKMGDGGFRLAYNVQFATGLDSRVIYGVDVVHTLDPRTSPRLMYQVQEYLKRLNLFEGIKNWLVDAAYSAKIDIITNALLYPNTRYLAAPKKDEDIDPKIRRKDDCKALQDWRARMNSASVKKLYKKRCSTAEFSNMHIKNQSLREFSVRGLLKVKGMAFLHAIAHNVNRFFDLTKQKKKSLLSTVF